VERICNNFSIEFGGFATLSQKNKSTQALRVADAGGAVMKLSQRQKKRGMRPGKSPVGRTGRLA
jgi:hypothetical protein